MTKSLVQKYVGQILDIEADRPYIDKINNTRPMLFFRGQSCSYGDTDLSASLYRNPKGEQSLIHEYTQMNSSEFLTMRNNGERLAQMQHNGLNTRLLDITKNVLVALFFAVEDSDFDNKDGIVWTFVTNNITKENEFKQSEEPFPIYLHYKYYDSDLLEILSTLCTLKDSSKAELWENINNFRKFLSEHNLARYYYQLYLDSLTNHIGTATVHQNSKYARPVQIPLKEYDLSLRKTVIEKYNDLNDSYSSKELYKEICNDIGSFDRVIAFDDLGTPFVFGAPFSNERIRAQSAYFIFEPFFNATTGEEAGERMRTPLLNNSINQVIIDSGDKCNLRKELDEFYSINRGTMFPDHFEGAKYVNNLPRLQ